MRILGMIEEHLNAGPIPVRKIAAEMGFRSRTSVQAYLTQLTRAGLIVRIGIGQYVRPEDPRAANPLPYRDDGFKRPLPDAKAVRRMPRVIPGITMAQLMGSGRR